MRVHMAERVGDLHSMFTHNHTGRRYVYRIHLNKRCLSATYNVTCIEHKFIHYTLYSTCSL